MKKEIKKGNTIIAEFMGYNHDVGYQSWEVGNFNVKYIRDAKYHSSWDWLMPVARIFKDLDIDNINYISHMQEIDSSIIDEYDITQLWGALVNAIIWYDSYHGH